MSDRAPEKPKMPDHAMWGGRFDAPPDEFFRTFNDSLPTDKRLVNHDIWGSIAWADAIREAGVLSQDECARIQAALREIGERAIKSPHSLDSAQDEDIHSWVERELIERVGDLGRKLHTGRSRNDQVALDLRLWLRDAVDECAVILIPTLARAILSLAECHRETIMPGYTHLQRAQPVLFAHWCLAYVEMLARDRDRLLDARRRLNLCPLGSGALAGSSFAINREQLAQALGFSGITANSIDAVSDRDWLIETVSAAATSMLHLSRLAEDLILYSSAEFGFVEMSDAVASGSSIMPQKKNPDALELIRGKTGRVLGDLISLMVMLKGTPLAYYKDFQEDKRPVFDAMDEWSLCLRMMTRVFETITVRPKRAIEAARGGYSNATALANYLAQRGVPFREAHDLTGRLVRAAIERGIPLERLTLDDIRRVAPQVGSDIFEFISLEAVLAQCDVAGGTAPMRVEAALREARRRLAAESEMRST